MKVQPLYKFNPRVEVKVSINIFLMLLLWLSLLPVGTVVRGTSGGCTDDMSCNLNGICNQTTGVCACTSLAWHGVSCELLALQPTPEGSDFNELETAGLSTWGASIVQLPPDRQWHM